MARRDGRVFRRRGGLGDWLGAVDGRVDFRSDHHRTDRLYDGSDCGLVAWEAACVVGVHPVFKNSGQVKLGAEEVYSRADELGGDFNDFFALRADLLDHGGPYRRKLSDEAGEFCDRGRGVWGLRGLKPES